MLAPVRTVAPAALAVSLEAAKQYLRYEDDDKDELIKSLLNAAIEEFDGYPGELSRALVDQTWSFSLPYWMWRTDFPLSPVRSVLSVKYFDGNNNQQTLDRANYTVTAIADASVAGGTRYAPLEDALAPYITWRQTAISWPITYWRDDAIEVTFIAGYGVNPDDVPEPIRNAIKMHVKRHFDALSPDESRRVEDSQSRLVDKFRRLKI